MKAKQMSLEVKGQLIDKIMGALKCEAILKGKHFPAGDTFLSLCFKTDKELNDIARLANVN